MSLRTYLIASLCATLLAVVTLGHLYFIWLWGFFALAAYLLSRIKWMPWVVALPFVLLLGVSGYGTYLENAVISDNYSDHSE